MAVSLSGARKLIQNEMFPALTNERTRLDRIDNWWRWSHDDPHKPQHATKEYRELAARAMTPWLGLVVSQLAQLLFVDGYRRAQTEPNVTAWSYWQANGMDGRQIAVHRAALAYGLSYETVLPGVTDQGEPMPVIRGVSPREMIAFYASPAEDDWPMFALRVEASRAPSGEKSTIIRLYDDANVWRFHGDAFGSRLDYVTRDEHSAGVCPVVRFANQLDLEGRADGEVEPFIPIAGRIDQTTFDRLVVQRFASWVVRTIAGMSKPETTDDVDAQKLRLRAEDVLVSTNPETKFGSLPATPLDGFINAQEHDVRTLAAVTQTTLADQLGQMANLSAEALAAARAALALKAEERKMSFGESHEQALRLGAALMGDEAGASDTSAEVRWRDMEPRSLAHVADALGKIAQMLGVPVEMLWERIPGFTDQDVDRAKTLRKAAPPAPPAPPGPEE